MHFSTTRWASLAAAAALIALPGSALAQTPPTSAPQNPPATQNPQQQPPATAASAQTPSNGQVDAAGAKQHLSEARDSLSQLTSMPEAARLQGDARTQVSQLISNFNALITTQSDWRSAYNKVNDNLSALLGPDADQNGAAAASGTSGSVTSATGTTAGTSGTGTSGTTGTTGTSASSTQIDPAIRAKLVEFRTHLKEFEKAAGGGQPSAPASPAASPASDPAAASSGSSMGSAASTGTAASGAMPPAAATGSTANPANPASPVNPGSAVAGTSGSDQTKAASAASGVSSQDVSNAQGTNAAAQQELAAIDAILSKSKTGTLTKTQTAELRRHVEALRALLK